MQPRTVLSDLQAWNSLTADGMAQAVAQTELGPTASCGSAEQISPKAKGSATTKSHGKDKQMH